MRVPYEILQQSKRKDYSSFVALVGVNTCAGEIRMIHEKGSAYLDRIHVRPEFRSSGIGRALLHQGESWAIQRNANSILVVFSPDNMRDLYPMMSFFESEGYKINGAISAVKRLRS